MSLINVFIAIFLVGFFCMLPAAIYVFAKCFTGRTWTFMDYNADAHP